MLKRYIPKFIVKGQVFGDIYSSHQAELDLLNNNVEDLINNMFIDTATWALRYWEKIYGLTIDESDTYENRRARIKAKMRSSGVEFTKENIKTICEAFSGGEVDVTTDLENDMFTITFVGTVGIPPKIEDLYGTIEDVKPAHLAVTYEFSYNTYGNIRDNLWTYGELTSYTHDEVRNSNDIKRI